MIGLARLLDTVPEEYARVRDVNVPSKAFGDLVEARRHARSLSAQEAKTLLDAQADVVVLDVRRFDEYQTMSNPAGISAPGGELVLGACTLAPDPHTRIIVNCAGRTPSIIAAQSLVNAGLPNPLSALRNGTIGWTLAHAASDTAGRACAEAITRLLPSQQAGTHAALVALAA